MLCKVCSSILQDQVGLIARRPAHLLFSHHATVFSLRNSVSQECYVCCAFCNELFSSDQGFFLSEILTHLVTHCQLSRREMTVLFTTVLRFYSLMILLVESTNIPDLAMGKGNGTGFVMQPSLDVKGYLGQPSTDSTASDECWKLATSWLSACQEHHERCNVSSEGTGWYSTRLLNVNRPKLKLGSDLVQLIDCAESPPVKVSYLALSHCWGATRLLCLIKSTIGDLWRGLDVSLLPQMFRDVILIARCLQITYLWIDSLCIIQDKDDRSDWLSEAGRMYKVYSNAILNISATGAPNSTKGLFAYRNPETLIAPEVELFLDGLQPSRESTWYRISRTLFWETELAQAPLIKCAWVLQERLLAPRVLHFGQNELLWECCEMEASETYPKGLPPALTIGAGTHFKRLDPLVDGRRLRQHGQQDMDPRFFGHELWKRVVEKYSASALTHSGDKLIALSGIAKRMARIVRDEYVVGMWRFCLESQLLWWVQHRRQANHEPSVRPAKYRAPSFSWASVDGCISPGDFTDKGILLEVVDVELDYVTEDVTGPVKGGSLLLKGSLMKLKLEHDTDAMTWTTIVNGVEVRWENSRPAILLDVDQTDFGEQNAHESLYFMPACAPVDRYQSLMSLLLERVVKEGDASAAQFRRLGVLMTSKQMLMPILLAPHDDEKNLPCRGYDEWSRRHTIALI